MLNTLPHERVVGHWHGDQNGSPLNYCTNAKMHCLEELTGMYQSAPKGFRMLIIQDLTSNLYPRIVT